MSRRSIDLVSNEVDALRAVEGWPAEQRRRRRRPGGRRPSHGDTGREFRWASVTKPVTALACLVAAEEGTIDLDEPAGPPGSTFRHLLAHASGLPLAGIEPDRAGRASGGSTPTTGSTSSARRSPGTRRCRSPTTCAPPCSSRSAWRARFDGRPGSGLHGSLDDLLAFARELLAPTLVAPETLAEATSVAVPRPRRRAPGLRPPGAERLGPRLRAPRREVAALDGLAQLAADVRPLRPQRHLPLGRPRRRARPRLPDRPRLRRLGEDRVAARSRTRCSERERAPVKQCQAVSLALLVRRVVARRQRRLRPTTAEPALAGWTSTADAPGIAQLAPELSGLDVDGDDRSSSPRPQRRCDSRDHLSRSPPRKTRARRRSAGPATTTPERWRTRSAPTRSRQDGGGTGSSSPRPAEPGSDTVEIYLVRRGRRLTVVELVSDRGFPPALREQALAAVSR